ncbi:MAG TPA: RDD family protein [Pseudonocardiaceae bacterium]|nr:RDD family protein [Pseudonocardiaceae bacterium]
MPERGPGSIPSMGRRLLALIVDTVFATLVTSLFVHTGSLSPDHVQTLNYWSLVTWFLLNVIGVGFFAASPGMVLLKLRVARVDGASYVFPLRAAVRTVLIAVLLPAVVWDRDHRGLHDKVAGTIVVSVS